jgi:hypothetical protein
MLLDRFMPVWHFAEYHQTIVKAPPGTVFRAVLEAELGRSPLVSLLFRLREIPWRLSRRDFSTKGLGSTLADLIELGFLPLAEEAPREFVFGLVGRFWTINNILVRIESDEFVSFDRPGYAKVAANLQVTPLAGYASRLSTETRIVCLDLAVKGRFRCYWTLIRPFSGLIRREWLRLARQEAEQRI